MAQNLKNPLASGLPPQNLEAEESVLGAMMISPGAITAVIELVHEQDFYRDSHRAIFSSIIDLFNQGEPADPVTVAEHLTSRGKLEQVGGTPYIHTLISTVPAASNASRYAGIVRENAVLRSLIEVGNRIAQLGYERPGEVRDLLDECEKMVFDISQNELRGEVRSLRELVSEQFEMIEKMREAGKAITGVPSGYGDLDEVTSGFQPSNLIILAARPSMGKTALALNIAQNVALNENKHVVIFSLEMSDSELAQRLLCTQAMIDGHVLRTGAVKKDDWSKLTDACNRLEKAPMTIVDSPGANMLEIRAQSRRLASKHDLGLVIIDYMQLMMPDSRSQSREQEVAKMSRSLKFMARDLKVPVLALSQLSRATEMRNPPRPMLSDLRESGSIEQDADLVMFLYRSRDDNGHLDSTTELILAKHRNGPTRTVNLEFLKQYMCFRSASKRV